MSTARNLVEYSDYRTYLKDYYSEQKKKNPGFSYRVFALRARLSSPNYLKLVIDGQRRITHKILPHFIRGLKLSKTEAEYFKTLVLFEESQDPEEKVRYLGDLARMRTRWGDEERTIERDRLDLLRGWHHWVIRELVLLTDFRPDPEWMVSKLRYRITLQEAREAWGVLERLEFVKKDTEGKYHLSEPLITTGDEIAYILLRNLHCHTLQFAVQSILRDPREEREVGGVTLAIPMKRLPEIKAWLRNVRMEFNQRFTQESDNDAVYNLSIAFFPMTK